MQIISNDPATISNEWNGVFADEDNVSEVKTSTHK